MTPRFRPVAASEGEERLYLLDGGGPGTYFYFVALETAAVGGALSIEASWNGPRGAGEADTPGWYVFVAERIQDGPRFAARVRERLPAVSRLKNGLTRRCISWIPRVDEWIERTDGPAAPSLALVQYSFQFESSRSVVAPGPELILAQNLRLRVPAGSRVDCLTDGVARFEITAGRLELRNEVGALTGAFPPPGGPRLAVPLTSERAGTVALRVRWDPATLRETYPCDTCQVIGGGGEVRKSLGHALFPRAAGAPDPNRGLGCDMWLDPLHAGDGGRNRLALDLDRDDDAGRRSRGLVSQELATAGGDPVVLRPRRSPRAAEAPPDGGPRVDLDPSAPGFALVESPPAAGEQDRRPPRRGLAPVGRFLVVPASAAGAAMARPMLGLTGTDGLTLAPGDELEFVIGRDSLEPTGRPPVGGTSEPRPAAHLRVEGLTIARGDTVVLRDLGFTVRRGEIFFLMGRRGCGKSSLLRALIGLERPARGDVLVDGAPPWSGRGQVAGRLATRSGVLFRTGALWRSMTLAENVALPLARHTTLDQGTIHEICRLKLALCGLAGREDAYPGEIGDGMRMRAGLARALALDPEILFLDQPTANLDPIAARRLDDLVLDLAGALGTTVVVASHDLASILAIGDNAVFLDAETQTMLATGNPRSLRDEADDPRVRSFLRRGRWPAGEGAPG